jgi:hypothetical protein
VWKYMWGQKLCEYIWYSHIVGRFWFILAAHSKKWQLIIKLHKWGITQFLFRLILYHIGMK